MATKAKRNTNISKVEKIKRVAMVNERGFTVKLGLVNGDGTFLLYDSEQIQDWLSKGSDILTILKRDAIRLADDDVTSAPPKSEGVKLYTTKMAEIQSVDDLRGLRNEDDAAHKVKVLASIVVQTETFP